MNLRGRGMRALRGFGGVPRTGKLLGAALALLGVAGCESDVKYGYFSVKVTMADTATPEILARINSCGVNVEGDDIDFSALDCSLGHVSKEVGTFEWSTTSTGTVRFLVTVKDVTGKDLGTGMSPDQRIVPDGTVPAVVVVNPTPEALKPPM
jgi:hypothetical protein